MPIIVIEKMSEIEKIRSWSQGHAHIIPETTSSYYFLTKPHYSSTIVNISLSNGTIVRRPIIIPPNYGKIVSDCDSTIDIATKELTRLHGKNKTIKVLVDTNPDGIAVLTIPDMIDQVLVLIIFISIGILSIIISISPIKVVYSYSSKFK